MLFDLQACGTSSAACVTQCRSASVPQLDDASLGPSPMPVVDLIPPTLRCAHGHEVIALKKNFREWTAVSSPSRSAGADCFGHVWQQEVDVVETALPPSRSFFNHLTGRNKPQTHRCGADCGVLCSKMTMLRIVDIQRSPTQTRAVAACTDVSPASHLTSGPGCNRSHINTTRLCMKKTCNAPESPSQARSQGPTHKAKSPICVQSESSPHTASSTAHAHQV